MNNLTIGMTIESAQTRYDNNQKPVHQAVGKFEQQGKNGTEFHSVDLLRFGDEGMSEGSFLVQGQLQIEKTEGGYREKIIISRIHQGYSPVSTIALVGRLGRNPEMRYFESGNCLSEFSIAVNRRSRDNKPDWFNCKFWGKTAQIAADYCRKGSQIGIIGYINFECWTDRQTGGDRRKLIVTGNQLELLGSREERSEHVPAATGHLTYSSAQSSTPDVPDDWDNVPF